MIDNLLSTSDEKFYSIFEDDVKDKYITEKVSIINFSINYAHGFESGFVAKLNQSGSVDKFVPHVKHEKYDELHGQKCYSLSVNEGDKFRIRFFHCNMILDNYYIVTYGKLKQYF